MTLATVAAEGPGSDQRGYNALVRAAVRSVAALGVLLVSASCGGAERGADNEPKRPAVVARIDTGQPVGLAAGFGSVWVADHREETVSRIDPQSNRVLRRIRVGRDSRRLVRR